MEWFIIIAVVEAVFDWAVSDPVVMSKIVTKSLLMAAAVTLGRWFVWGQPKK
ncbi:MAG: hypothetical protein ACKOOL_06520 [Novosphingobium sp.]